MKKLLVLSALSIFISAPALAQQESQTFIPPGTNYENTNVNTIRTLQKQSLAKEQKMEVDVVEISLIHPDYLEDDQVALQMKLPNAETGCHTYSPIEYEANFIDPYFMDVKLKHYRKTTLETQAPQFECDVKSKVVSAMIVLGLSDLKNRGTKEIRLSNGKNTDIYKVSFIDNRLRLTPQSMIAFKAKNMQGPDKNYLEYDIAQNHMVVLNVPMAQPTDDIEIKVRALGYQNSLNPVFDDAGQGKRTLENTGFYFHDSDGAMASLLGEEGYLEIGTIDVLRPYDGSNGRTGLPVPLKVFLTKPQSL